MEPLSGKHFEILYPLHLQWKTGMHFATSQQPLKSFSGFHFQSVTTFFWKCNMRSVSVQHLGCGPARQPTNIDLANISRAAPFHLLLFQWSQFLLNIFYLQDPNRFMFLLWLRQMFEIEYNIFHLSHRKVDLVIRLAIWKEWEINWE